MISYQVRSCLVRSLIPSTKTVRILYQLNLIERILAGLTLGTELDLPKSPVDWVSATEDRCL